MERGSSASPFSRLISTAHAVLLKQTRSFAFLGRYLLGFLVCSYRFLAFHVNPFWIQLFYFLFLTFMGSLGLMVLKPSVPTFTPKYVDMLYLSASALTVSGLSTVEMEVLSQSQVVVYSLLMLLGGEVWVSLLGILVRLPKLTMPVAADGRLFDPVISTMELTSNEPRVVEGDVERGLAIVVPEGLPTESKDLKYRCLRLLAYIVFAYILLIHVSGSLLIFWYISLVSSAKDVLKGKGIRILPFCISITISSFANAGLIPTNEGMMVFKKNAGLLLLMVPQILAGNTLFPVFLRLVVWALRGLTGRAEMVHMMKGAGQVGYLHLMPSQKTWFLGLTVAGFLAAQMTVFCGLEWKTDVLAGLSWVQKLAAALFQTVNSRHAGEATFDLSAVSPAMLVLFVVMMYLPAYASFLPLGDGSASSEKPRKDKKGREVTDKLNLSQLSYIAIFVIILCIIERQKMAEDPLNFSVFNMVFEATSAYGNVGFSLGYSCARQVKPDAGCKDAWYGFSGRFSTAGKLMIVFIMLFGRFKKFHMGGGKAWKLI